MEDFDVSRVSSLDADIHTQPSLRPAQRAARIRFARLLTGMKRRPDSDQT